MSKDSNKISPFYLSMCGAYDLGHNKNFITPTVCIGDGDSSYERFNVVINANFPPNRIKHQNVARREESVYNNKCTLYLVGMFDHESEPLDFYLDYLIPRLRTRYEENPKCRFLFHCFAGKSRSVALALAFLVEVMGMQFDNALELVKEKRPIVQPKQAFIQMLRERYSLH
jgi:protein-tyrosine phosphatase